MKRAAIFAVFVMLCMFLAVLLPINANAADNNEATESEQILSNYGIIKDNQKQNLFDALSPDAKKSMEDLGITDINPDMLKELSFESLLGQVVSAAAKESAGPLRSMTTVIAVMLLGSVLSGVKSTLNSSKMQQVIDIVTTLCVTSALIIPVGGTIEYATDVIAAASGFMLAYIPIMLVVMVSSGQAAAGSAYYSMTMMAAQGVSQAASKVISPLLNCFLGISIAGAVSPAINLSGITSLISKVIKWLLGFVMTLFTAVLSFKQIITTSIDNVSARAVRFTLTSLVPVVGSALSDAYKTVQSSVGLLKSGLGVFVIIGILVVFLPVLVQCFIWIVTIGVSKTAAEILNLSRVAKILEAVSVVVTTLLAVILCIMSVYVISTALVLLLGGAKA